MCFIAKTMNFTVVFACDPRKLVRMNIYVGNLSYTATEADIEKLFAECGEVTSVRVIKDKFTGNPRGFAFVEMASDSEGQAAIDKFNGFELKGRPLRVNEARPQENNGGNSRPRSPRGGRF